MKSRLNNKGFTFLTALMLVMVIGIMLGAIGQSWKTIMRREREKELLFRGNQIKEAIENWYNPKWPPGTTRTVRPLTQLKDLESDPYAISGTNATHYLRRVNYGEIQDPMTGKEWELIRGSIGGNTQGQQRSPSQIAMTGLTNTTTSATLQGIIGVFSKSEGIPLKVDFSDFPALESFSGKTKYSDWKFIADPTNIHSQTYRGYREK